MIDPSKKNEFIHHAKALKNNALLQKVIVLSCGDSYEGEFTMLGELEYEVFCEELRSRLGNWLLQ